MKSKISQQEKMYPFIIFLIIEFVIFILRSNSVIDHNLFKTLSFPVSFSILCLLEAWQAYRNKRMSVVKVSLVFAAIFIILSFI